MQDFMSFMAHHMGDNYGDEDSIPESMRDASSSKARKLGNRSFRDRDHGDALRYFNWALINAGEDAVQTSMAYLDRAAVYLHLGFYKHCLHNLDLAEPNLPQTKIQKLNERRARCTRLMNNRQEAQIDPPDYFSQLSYPANPKLPFFIDALELRENETFGRHIVTTRDLKAGDVAAVFEKPWNFHDTSEVTVTNGCYHCMKVNDLDLVPGVECRGGELKLDKVKNN